VGGDSRGHAEVTSVRCAPQGVGGDSRGHAEVTCVVQTALGRIALDSPQETVGTVVIVNTLLLIFELLAPVSSVLLLFSRVCLSSFPGCRCPLKESEGTLGLEFPKI
jgi:hypothetical protein